MNDGGDYEWIRYVLMAVVILFIGYRIVKEPKKK